MMEGLARLDALRYLGLCEPTEPVVGMVSRMMPTADADAELTRIVLAYDLEVEVDDDGYITTVEGGEQLREAFFEEYARRFGRRPDDPEARAEALTEAARAVEAAQAHRRERRQLLIERRDNGVERRHERKRDAT